MTGVRMDRRLLALLYILAFVLLREWLMPVMELTDTNYLGLFLLFSAVAFLLSLAKVKKWIAVPIKIIYILWAIHYVFLDKVLFSKETMVYLFKDLISNVSIIISGDWDNITNPLKTILFFSLLWMTTYLIRHWIEVRKSILLFYIMTVVFIAFIDTFSPYSADGAIFRIMVTGLLLLGLLFISRLAEKHDTSISTGTFVSFSVPLLFAIVVSGAVVNYLPKQEPIWPDPLPYFKSIINGSGVGGGTGVSKSGYDMDDSALGGSFMQDNTIVFEAKVADKQYWKIETKNTYTSKGWEQVASDNAETIYTPGMEMDVSDLQGQASVTPQLRAELQVSEPFPFIVYPYGMSKVHTNSDVLFLHSEASGKYSTKMAGSEGSLNSYEIDFKEPDYSLKELNATRMEDYSTQNEDFAPYLQLPKQLPERVRELAKTITEEHVSVYEKTKAIEKYFGRNGFVYTQQGVATPAANEDYVDQFLFDTKSGYCDNFSTSMVVMLRAADIPARWVKGFASGQSVKDEDGEQVYRVTNNEAHSWVEAYMPGIGWMPFEPTIGFSNLTDIDYDIESNLSDPQAPEVEKPERPKREQTKKPVIAEKNMGIGEFFKSINSWIKVNLWKVVISILVLLLIAWRLFIVRAKWLPKVHIYVYRSGKGGWITFAKQYKCLLKQLDRLGLKRASGMTLSDYAKNVDNYFGGERMRLLTAAYEKGLYGGNTTNHEWVKLREVWEDLINRTSG